MLAFLQLRASKPSHAAWSCAEVSVAFEALANVHELATDSIATVIKYFADEKVNGTLLSLLALDSDILKELAPNSLRRHRLSGVLSAMCSDPVVAASASAVPAPAAAAVSVSVPLVAVLAAGIISAASSSPSSDALEDQAAALPVRDVLSDALHSV